MNIYPGMWLHKIRSGRDAQVAGMDTTHVWLTWEDDGSQTVIQRARLNRKAEWRVVRG